MRVLFLLSAPAGGGAERCAIEVLRSLQDRPCQLHLGLFDLHGPYLPEIPAGVQIVDLSADPITERFARTPLVVRKWLLTSLQLGRAVRSLEPDVVVSFLPETSLPASAVKAFDHPPAFRWIISEQNATRTRVREGNPNRLKRLFQDRWIRLAYPAADHVIAVSHGVKGGLIADYGVHPQRISVIYNPIDIERIRREAEQAVAIDWPQEPVILGVGKLSKQKGFDILIQSFARVRHHQAAKLVILGSGEEQKALENLARSLGLERDLIMPGFVSNPWAYMARARMFVLSSRWEGFGNVLPEAMACGTPVIATNCNHGPGEIVTHETNGLLVPVGDGEALSVAIIRLLQDRPLAHRLAEAGRQRAQDFAVGLIAQQYEALLHQMMA